jgi:hypothetical protein
MNMTEDLDGVGGAFSGEAKERSATSKPSRYHITCHVKSIIFTYNTTL